MSLLRDPKIIVQYGEHMFDVDGFFILVYSYLLLLGRYRNFAGGFNQLFTFKIQIIQSLLLDMRYRR